MTVIVTRDVVPRFRGFLASCMLEIGPGVYTGPRMTRAVRDRVWMVLEKWFGETGGGSIVLTWNEPAMPGGQDIRTLGLPPIDLVLQNGVILARRRLQEVAEPAVTAPSDGRDL
jgi:CRISPR-associated protein Cas2